MAEINSYFIHLKNITIEDLLCHRIEIWTDGYLGDVKNKEDFNKILYSAYVKKNFPKYVDIHYIILSKILETVYQKDLEDLLQEKILEPLGLKNTSFNLAKNDSYVSTNGEMRNNEIVFVPPREIHDQKARIASKF